MLHLIFKKVIFKLPKIFSDATLSYFNDASKLGYQRIPQLLHSFILVLTSFLFLLLNDLIIKLF